MGIALFFKFAGAEHLRIGHFPARQQKTETHGGIAHYWSAINTVAVLKGIAVEKNIPCHQAGIKGNKGVQTTDGQTAVAYIAPPRGTVVPPPAAGRRCRNPQVTANQPGIRHQN